MKIIKVSSCLDCPYFLCSEGGDQYCDYLEKDLEDYDLDDINIVPDCPLEDYVEQNNNIIKLVNEQTTDEGLWFDAQCVTEAYLQQALRRLHEVIEQNSTETKSCDGCKYTPLRYEHEVCDFCSRCWKDRYEPKQEQIKKEI